MAKDTVTINGVQLTREQVIAAHRELFGSIPAPSPVLSNKTHAGQWVKLVGERSPQLVYLVVDAEQKVKYECTGGLPALNVMPISTRDDVHTLKGEVFAFPARDFELAHGKVVLL